MVTPMQFVKAPLITLFLILCFVGKSSLFAEVTGFSSASDLPSDPAIKYGVMENGLTYALMPNKEPQKRVAMRLFIRAGSLQEKDHQRGMAHFLEHMAFNGTENFAAGEMVEFFQRLGMGFGAHTNAYTSFDQTVYMLDLPHVEDDVLNPALTFFRDLIVGMNLEEEEIEKERGVILAEKRSRDSPQFRMFEAEYEFLLKDTLAADRMVIGTDEAIKGVQRSDFVEYYDAYYRPERMALVVVGDFDPAHIESRVIEAFAKLTKPESTVEDPLLGDLPEELPQYGYFSEMEAPYVAVGVNAVTPYTPKEDSLENRKKRLILDLAYAIVNRRFEKRAKEEDAPFLGASVSKQAFFRFAEIDGLNATTQAENWEAAVAELEQAIRKAVLYGFTESELREVKAREINALKESVARKSTRNSRSLAMGLVRAYDDQRVILSPEDRLRLFEPFVESLKVEDLNAAFRAVFADAEPRIFVAGNVEIDPAQAESLIESAWKQSQAVELEAPVDEGEMTFAYQEFGAPGRIVERETKEDLDIQTFKFENHVQTFAKKTDFKDNEILISVRVGGGLLTLGDLEPAVATFASQTFSAGGLEAHSADDITSIFAGKNVSVGFEVGQDAFTFGAATTPDDLLDTLKLLTANIKFAGYREEAVNVAKRYFEAVEQYIAHNAEGVMFDAVPRFMYSEDPRFGWPERAKLDGLTMESVKAWLEPTLESAAIEVAVVGDFEYAVLEEALSLTLGALDERAESVPDYAEARKVSFPEGGQDRTFTFSSEQPKGVMLKAWPTDDISDISQARRLNMLSSVVRDRMRVEIREKLGEAYSPRASHSASQTFTDYGRLTAQVVGDVEKLELLHETVAGIAAGLVEGGTTEDELGRVLKPTLTGLEEQLRNNAYWLYTVMSGATTYPDQFDWARSIFSDYESITVEDINELAKMYLKPEHAVSVSVVPEAK
ncbi:MAG: M16 family metallopeptidase [Opitutales bacterium]